MASGSAQASDNANAKVHRQNNKHKEMASPLTPVWSLVANGYFVEGTLIGTENCLDYRSVKPRQDRTGQVSQQERLT